MVKRIAKRSRPVNRSRSRTGPSFARIRALVRQGKLEEAARLGRAAIAARPDDYRTMALLASFLSGFGHHHETIRLAKRALELAPENSAIRADIVAHWIIAAGRAREGVEQAIALGKRALKRHGPSPLLMTALLRAESTLGRYADALRTANKAIALYPRYAPLHFNKSIVLLRLNRPEESVAAYTKGVKPYARGARRVADRVRSRYDSHADTYDANAMHRSTSERMGRFVGEILGTTKMGRVLEAGCGTGLFATHVKAASIVGVDLSPKMLDKARARNLYDELVCADMVKGMAARGDTFDAIVSSGAIYFLADLEPFFEQAARLLRPGGYLFFSCDPLADTRDIGITTPGEYAHGRRYLRSLAAKTGFAEAAIRIMEHRVAPGFWCAFRRQ